MHYTEGTIDAIDIFGGTLRFSLLPSSGYLMSRDDGTKKAIFMDSSSTNAIMVDPEKNANGKEVVCFSFDKEQRDVLLSAKNNRNTIRVWCTDMKKKEADANEPTPPIATIKAKGIRVF